jgi:hypothetical protein
MRRATLTWITRKAAGAGRLHPLDLAKETA